MMWLLTNRPGNGREHFKFHRARISSWTYFPPPQGWSGYLTFISQVLMMRPNFGEMRNVTGEKFRPSISKHLHTHDPGIDRNENSFCIQSSALGGVRLDLRDVWGPNLRIKASSVTGRKTSWMNTFLCITDSVFRPIDGVSFMRGW